MTAAQTRPCLSQLINIATRPLHTELNTLIISLLPLALPPHTSDPNLYVVGISQILPIYEALEGGLRLLQARTHIQNENDQTLLQALKTLHILQLERTRRLRNDIGTLHRWFPTYTSETSNIHKAKEKQLPKLIDFTNHITTISTTRPHLLLSYTWILYMALFSGGRYIRGRLRQAGPTLWTGPGPESTDTIGDVLTFWTFDGEQDGEDIKAEFKRRFAAIEALITEVEKEEVVAEGVYIMKGMISVVGEIAEAVGTADAGSRTWEKEVGLEDGRRDPQALYEPDFRWLLLKHILPLGMGELMTGAARALIRGAGPRYWNIIGVDAEVR